MMTQTTSIPQDLKEEYPFNSNYFEVGGGHRYHYIDEGPKEAKPLIMVHGNPTWSFFYRNLIKKFSLNRRVIVVDHIGCGLSDKPQDYDYTLENHISNLSHLFEAQILPQLKTAGQKFDLIVHDWGGAIGMGLATRYKDYIDHSVIMNTAAYTDDNIPASISVCKLPVVGEKLVRHFNAFAWPATFMAVEKPLKKAIKKGYLLPYDSYQNRIATARFVKDIPMDEKHPTWATLKEIENNLKEIPGKKLLLWGQKDFCFSPHFFNRWRAIFPEAETCMLEKAGHYLLEDEPVKTTLAIEEFLQ